MDKQEKQKEEFDESHNIVERSLEAFKEGRFYEF